MDQFTQFCVAFVQLNTPKWAKNLPGKQTCPLKNSAWNTSLSFCNDPFLGEEIVHVRVVTFVCLTGVPRFQTSEVPCCYPPTS